MPWTDDEQKKCYGATEKDLHDSFTRGLIKCQSDYMMYAMSILSDVQFILENRTFGNETDEVARKWINRSKYYMKHVHLKLREEGK